MPSVTLTERESAVIAAVFTLGKTPTLTADEWNQVAAKAGIDNGDVARNAKFAFTQLMKKVGVKTEAKKGPKAGDKRKKVQQESPKVDEDGEGEADAGGEEDESTPVKKGKGAKKPKVEVKEE
ncbi:hypothetical protein CAC42_6287 [Sphaceloma murrayae]|uniref:Uncharacterized protein n=1 Tax=Sphaceloma murrayae TaxID=2082308 RepID=A0A2K1QU34_9PEZI|nr:hypothetical protein CAC42_6287 [Sphaceloma murrayae]